VLYDHSKPSRIALYARCKSTSSAWMRYRSFWELPLCIGLIGFLLYKKISINAIGNHMAIAFSLMPAQGETGWASVGLIKMG
jgi:hypothetical protein